MRVFIRFCIPFLLPFFITQNSFAQEEIGLNPPSLKWNQISTPAGKVIFPEGFDSMAYRAAGIMAYQRVNDKSFIGTGKTKRIPTIIQNQSSLPAGFATPAPWRNEFYITPPQNLFTGPVPWFDYLTVHEYRHAQQFYMANQGFTLPLKVLMGQTGWLLHALINQPLWFREGDAVTSETLLTKAGRGRQPRFHMEYRAMRLSNYHFNYEKANYPASFKDFVPNPYRIGYYMTTKLRRDYGDSIWQKVVYDTYHKNPVYGFNRSLKKHTGYSTKTLYNQTVKELDSIFQQTEKKLSFSAQKVITKDPGKTYTNYRFPHELPDGSMIILKDAFDEIRAFYKIHPDGSEEKMFVHGIYTDDHVMFAANNEFMTWAESGFDKRWINRDYSIIKTYNFKTGKTRKLTSKTRYFAPAPSPDGSKIIAVHSDNAGKNRLVVLEAQSGKLLRELPNPGNPFLAQPRWQHDNENVVTIAVNNQGNSLLQTNTQTGETRTLLSYTTVPVSRPFPAGNYVYFSAGFTSIDNIYALETATGKIYQITSVRFGAYEPTISENGQKLLYSNYTAKGYELAETALNPANWEELTPVQNTDINLHEPLLQRPGNQDITDSTFRQNYPVKRYHSLTAGLFNIYGWFPMFGNNEYGAEFYTRNLMSTMRGTLGIFYNTNENALGSKINLTYAAFYPVFELEYGLQTRRKAEIRTTLETTVLEQEWTEKYGLAGIKFPFRLTQGKYRTNLEIGGAFGYYDIDFVPNAETTGEEIATNFYAYKTTLNFSRLLPQARQHVKPRWGQIAQLQYQRAINDATERLFANTVLYFPGLKKTHSFHLEGRWKKEEVQETYRFSDNFIMPRGYKSDPFSKIWVASANYEFPIWYPDLALGRILFLQRFRTNLFYDRSKVELLTTKENLNSTGAELFTDLRVLRLFSMTMGFRYNYILSDTSTETTPFQFVVTRFELAN
ncbi:hypothetical protein [Adhaeribacter terreus]|uniref:WD40-like Beta Propeller Repeat n=1 Tax=Adhaeribacter terreus TaxID=529703 RepID=A0ABW0EG73_9BACT